MWHSSSTKKTPPGVELRLVTIRDLGRRRLTLKGQDYKNVILASCWRLLLKTRLIALILASACLPQAVLEIEEPDENRYEVPSPSGA